MLAGRRVVVIGDSIGRFVYYALARSLGDEAGAAEAIQRRRRLRRVGSRRSVGGVVARPRGGFRVEWLVRRGFVARLALRAVKGLVLVVCF